MLSLPRGFVVVEDQRLQPEPPEGFRIRRMQFVYDRTIASDGTLELNPIEADPFPTVGGTVYRPILRDGETRIVPVDSDDLEVTLSCTGAPEGNAPVVVLSDAEPNPGKDTFEIDRDNVDLAVNGTRQQTRPSDKVATRECRVDAKASPDGTEFRGSAGFTVTARDGPDAAPRRNVNVLIEPPAPNDLTGTVGWPDVGDPTPGSNPGSRQLRAGVEITTLRPDTQAPRERGHGHHRLPGRHRRGPLRERGPPEHRELRRGRGDAGDRAGEMDVPRHARR